jgi:hypothetical protein
MMQDPRLAIEQQISSPTPDDAVRGMRHFLFYDQRERFNRELAEFLEE